VAWLHAARSLGGARASRGAARRPLIRRAETNTVLAQMPDAPQTPDVLRGLVDEPGRELCVVAGSTYAEPSTGALTRLRRVCVGTVTVLPAHAAPGAQTANLVFDIADNQWQLPERGGPVAGSSNGVVGSSQAHGRFELTRDALAQADSIIE
jgi:hypothetical protein